MIKVRFVEVGVAQSIVQVHDADHRTFKATMAYAFADHMILASTQGTSMAQAIGEVTEQPHETAKQPSLMSVEDIVKRACDLSERLYLEMKRRSFIVEIPTPSGEWHEVE